MKTFSQIVEEFDVHKAPKGFKRKHAEIINRHLIDHGHSVEKTAELTKLPLAYVKYSQSVREVGMGNSNVGASRGGW